MCYECLDLKKKNTSNVLNLRLGELEVNAHYTMGEEGEFLTCDPWIVEKCVDGFTEVCATSWKSYNSVSEF